MLVLGRKQGESLRVDGPCEIVVKRIRGSKVQIGIIGEQSTKILRTELLSRGEERSDEQSCVRYRDGATAG
jgi:carbon storage regulator CsrA